MIKKALFQHVTRHSQNEEMFQAALTMSLEEVKNGYIQKILDSKKEVSVEMTKKCMPDRMVLINYSLQNSTRQLYPI